MNMISKLHFSTPKLFITFQGSKLIAMNMNRVVKLLTDPHSVSIYQLLGIGPKNHLLEKVSEYDQEIPQSQTADNPVAPRGRAAQPSQDNRKTN